MKIGILDYNACNIKSVYNAVYRLGYNPHVIENYSEIKEQDKLIIPGVGSAFKTVDYLKKKNLFDSINEFIDKSKPTMGICLGLQLLCKNLYEGGSTHGFNKFDCDVIPLRKEITNVGWVDVDIEPSISSSMNLKTKSSFYFCHSYFLKFNKIDEKRFCLGSALEDKIPSILVKNNLIGLQFHPEKSQSNGEEIINFFLNKF